MYPLSTSLIATFAFFHFVDSESVVTISSTLPASTVYVSAPTGIPPPSYTNNLDLRTSVLNSTNFFRYEHNASFVGWNASLATYAANYASQCIWAHSHGAPGENLARGYPDITSSVDAWGNERDLYNFDTSNPTGFSEATGHFTQLVWKSTQTVGCAVENCDGRNGLQGWLLVCEYWPPGNILSGGSGNQNQFFIDNVSPERSGGSQGFNTFSATVGATGVTGWATGTIIPTSSPTASNGGWSGKVVRSKWWIITGVLTLSLGWVM